MSNPTSISSPPLLPCNQPPPCCSELNFHSQSALFKTYLTPQALVRRTLRPHEQLPACPPQLANQARERLINEASALRLIKSVTSIPVPNVVAEYEDDGAYVLITGRSPLGVKLSSLKDDEKKAAILDALRLYIETLHRLGSHNLGSISGHAILPAWASNTRDNIAMLASYPGERFVAVHGDLGEENVIVDPETSAIKMIVGWETAGFWPEWVEGREFRRMGPGASWWVRGEDVGDRQERMAAFLRARAVRPW